MPNMATVAETTMVVLVKVIRLGLEYRRNPNGAGRGSPYGDVRVYPYCKKP